MSDSVGERVRACMSRVSSPPTQAEVASAIEMTPDAFSRAINGARSFSSVEIARLADFLKCDAYWLITGTEDPMTARFAARHTYDPVKAEHFVPGANADESVLRNIELAYRQAGPWIEPPVHDLPSNPTDIAFALGGPGFVTQFAERVDDRLGIDVIRLPGLHTDYSLTIGGRGVIVLRTNSNWFNANWSIAHELGHLALRHHNEMAATRTSPAERAVNAFAAELLLPEETMKSIDWARIERAQVAQLIWNWGVSTEALMFRLKSLSLPTPAGIQEADRLPTALYLRGASDHLETGPGVFLPVDQAIAERMSKSAERSVPVRLLQALIAGTEAGFIRADMIAWLLETDSEDLNDFLVGDATYIPDDVLADALGMTDANAR